MSITNKINTLFDLKKEKLLISTLQNIVGVEQFRPKIDVISTLLEKSVNKIEQESRSVIVVAGTNGKGETCHNIRYLLNQAGFSTALWTSPHVLTLCERMMFNENLISYDRLHALILEYVETAKIYALSFYEFLFYLFIKEVDNIGVDYLILEVGLGGRFDAVNIFSHPVTAICSISRDHTAILGNSLKLILKEKYGIHRSHSSLYSGVEQQVLKDLLKNWTDRDEVNLIEMPLVESYALKNQEMAIKIVEDLGILVQRQNIEWPVSKGRREKVTFLDRNFIFIGAHNLDGHRKMLKMLNNSGEMNKTNDVLLLSFSTGREDQIEDISLLYSQAYPCLFGDKFLTHFSSARAIGEDILKQHMKDGFSYLSDWNLILNDSYKNKNIYIVGSYFFISDFQLFLNSFN